MSASDSKQPLQSSIKQMASSSQQRMLAKYQKTEELFMASAEFEELRDLITEVKTEVVTIKKSLKSCQSHCYIDNPPGKWVALARAIKSIFKPDQPKIIS